MSTKAASFFTDGQDQHSAPYPAQLPPPQSHHGEREKKRKDENNAVVSSPSQLMLPEKPDTDYAVHHRTHLQLEYV